MTTKTTNRTARIQASASKAAFTAPKSVNKPDAFDTEGQFRILALTRCIKRLSSEFDEFDEGDALWRAADAIAQIIEARP
jgi:hypothetical protein